MYGCTINRKTTYLQLVNLKVNPLDIHLTILGPPLSILTRESYNHYRMAKGYCHFRLTKGYSHFIFTKVTVFYMY